MESKSMPTAYATKGNILFPGTQVQADIAEQRAADDLESLGYVADGQQITGLTITPAP